MQYLSILLSACAGLALADEYTNPNGGDTYLSLGTGEAQVYGTMTPQEVLHTLADHCDNGICGGEYTVQSFYEDADTEKSHYINLKIDASNSEYRTPNRNGLLDALSKLAEDNRVYKKETFKDASCTDNLCQDVYVDRYTSSRYYSIQVRADDGAILDFMRVKITSEKADQSSFSSEMCSTLAGIGSTLEPELAPAFALSSLVCTTNID